MVRQSTGSVNFTVTICVFTHQSNKQFEQPIIIRRVMTCPYSGRVVDMRRYIQARFSPVRNNISGLFSASFGADADHFNPINHPVSSGKQLSIFKNHFNAMFIHVHFSATSYVMFQIKNVHGKSTAA